MAPLNIGDLGISINVLFSNYLLVIAIGYSTSIAFVFIWVVSVKDIRILPRKPQFPDRRHVTVIDLASAKRQTISPPDGWQNNRAIKYDALIYNSRRNIFPVNEWSLGLESE